MTPQDEDDLGCLVCVLLVIAMLWFAVFSSKVLAQDYDLDLPVIPPEYRSPEERTLRPIPDVGPPEHPVEPDPTDDDPEPVLFYGQEIADEQSSVVYVLDFSDSMGVYTTGFIIVQDSPTSTHTIPIFYADRLKEEFAASVNSLSANMRFNVVVFDCNVTQWSNVLVRATASSKADAAAWVNSRQPGGATGTAAAVAVALQDPEVESVILLTDGMPTCPTSDWESHRETIRQNNPRHIPIHCFGLGDVRNPFLNAVAADSGGTCVEVR